MVTVGLGVTLVCTIRYDIVETHCYVVISGEWILMSIYVRMYVAESSDAGCFGHLGLRQLLLCPYMLIKINSLHTDMSLCVCM